MSAPQLSAIEKALAAAKARKAAKSEGESAPVVEAAPKKAPKAPKEKVAKAPNPEKVSARAAKAAEREQARRALELLREEKRALRLQKRAERAAQAAQRGTPHMKKVNNARAKLPALNGESTKMYDEILSNFSVAQIEALSAHLALGARAKKTESAAVAARLPLGATVRVTGGDPRYIGKVGTVVHSQKLRAKVEVPGLTRLVYIYNGEATEI